MRQQRERDDREHKDAASHWAADGLRGGGSHSFSPPLATARRLREEERKSFVITDTKEKLYKTTTFAL